MSTSSPVRTRQPRRPPLPSQAGSNPPPRVEAAVIVVRSILLVVAAILVIATSNYFAYLIGRKQVTYEELRRQVDRIVDLMEQKRAEGELAVTTLKQRQERLEQNASGLIGLTTSTINGKTIATPEPAPDRRPLATVLIDDKAVAPDLAVHLQPPESPLNATTKQRDTHGVAYKRGSRRHKVSPTAAAPKRGPATPAIAEQSGQLTAARPATPDAGLASQ